MKIGIIDADLLDNGTRHPNLALMKLSGFHKSCGNIVELVMSYDQIDNYDQLYLSKVFSFTHIPEHVLNRSNLIIGGTGFFNDGGENLPPEIEHHMPDYSLYDKYIELEKQLGKNSARISDYQFYSIGFTTRGCFRKCEFCVNKKYNKVVYHSPVSEFLNTERPYIYLWDDNFLAYSDWSTVLDDLEATKKPFQFRQGLDIRLMTEEKATRLSKVNYHGDFIFAFDHLKDADIIEKKLALWRRHTSKTTKLYVLCAYESQDEQDIISVFKRIKILMKYGCLPYIMRYKSYEDSPWRALYVQIARWCNQPQFFKKKSFRQFCEANQDYHRNKETLCLAYSSMLSFESSFPEIAEAFFDLRFEEENKYGLSYGYGRRYAHKQDCALCQEQQQSWENAYHGIMSFNKALCLYFAGKLDLQCLTYREISCVDTPSESIASWFMQQLLATPLQDIYQIIVEQEEELAVLPSNIPQISNLEDAYIHTPEVLWRANEGISYDILGRELDNGGDKNIVAQRKYGENHSKCATLLDLAVITQPNNSYLISSSLLGLASRKLPIQDKSQLSARLAFRIPVIQSIFKKAHSKIVTIEDELNTLSAPTRKRRASSVRHLINLIQENVTLEDNIVIDTLANIARQ